MRHVWTVVCDKIILEGPSEKISLLSLPEVLTIQDPKFLEAAEVAPVILQVNLRIAAEFWMESDDEPGMEIRFLLSAPAGSVQLAGPQEIPRVTGKRNSSFRVFGDLEQIIFQGLGLYSVDLETRAPGQKRWKRVSSYPLEMRVVEARASTAPEHPSEPSSIAPQPTASQPSPSRPSGRRAATTRRRRP